METQSKKSEKLELERELDAAWTALGRACGTHIWDRHTGTMLGWPYSWAECRVCGVLSPGAAS